MGYFEDKTSFSNIPLTKYLKMMLGLLLKKYFQNQDLKEFSTTKHEHYLQQKEICKLFSYELWSTTFYRRSTIMLKLL